VRPRVLVEPEPVAAVHFHRREELRGLEARAEHDRVGGMRAPLGIDDRVFGDLADGAGELDVLAAHRREPIGGDQDALAADGRVGRRLPPQPPVAA